MRMRAFCACLMVSFFWAMPSFAQDRPSDEHQIPTAEDIVAQMQVKLNLTQDQVAAITPIIEKYSSKRAVIRQNIEEGATDRDSMRLQMKQLRADESQELAQVLSAGQLSQFEQMSKMHRPQPQAPPPDHDGDKSPPQDQ